jgi:hypothetical protein
MRRESFVGGRIEVPFRNRVRYYVYKRTDDHYRLVCDTLVDAEPGRWEVAAFHVRQEADRLLFLITNGCTRGGDRVGQ